MGLQRGPTVKKVWDKHIIDDRYDAALQVAVGLSEAYDGSGDFDDWLQRLLSYLSLDNLRYNIIAQQYLEYAPKVRAREQLGQFYDADLLCRGRVRDATVPSRTVRARRTPDYEFHFDEVRATEVRRD